MLLYFHIYYKPIKTKHYEKKKLINWANRFCSIND